MTSENKQKEFLLPYTWYRSGEYASERLLWEKEKMLQLFKISEPNEIILPKSTWDRESFTLVTKKMELVTMHDLEQTPCTRWENIDEKRFDLAWNIEFQMMNSEHLPYSTTVWKMMAAYPPDIAKPGRNIFYRNLPDPEKLHAGGPPVHILSTRDLEDGQKCCRICYYEHDQPTRFLDPDLPMSEHVFMGIKWLRAHLRRNGNMLAWSDMPTYFMDYE